MGVAGHKHRAVAARLLIERGEKHGDVTHEVFNLAANEKAQIHEHLVVARASGVDFLPHVAKTAGEHQFHLRVNIFNSVFNQEIPCFYFSVDFAQGSSEHFQLIGGE